MQKLNAARLVTQWLFMLIIAVFLFFRILLEANSKCSKRDFVY